MKEYSFAELFFTMDTCRLFLGLDPNTDQQKIEAIMESAMITYGRNYSPLTKRIRPEDFEKLNEITKAIVDSNGDEEIFIKMRFNVCFPFPVSDKLKTKLTSESYLNGAFREAVRTVAGEKALGKPFNLPFESCNNRIENVVGKIENPYTISAQADLIFSEFKRQDIDNFKQKTYLGTFSRERMRQSSRDSEMKFRTTEDGWRNTDYRMWDLFPYDSVYLGLYVYFANPNIFTINPATNSEMRGDFELLFLPKSEMDIEKAIEAAAGSLFDSKAPSASEVISVLTAVCNDKRLNQFVDLHYSKNDKDAEITFNDDVSCFNSNVYFKLCSTWYNTESALRDVKDCLLACKRAARMFNGLKDLLEELKSKNIEVIKYAQDMFKEAMFTNPFKFTGEEFKIENTFARMMLSRNPKIHDLATLILSKIDESSIGLEDDDEDIDVGTVTIDSTMSIFEAENVIKEARRNVECELRKYPKTIYDKVNKICGAGGVSYNEAKLKRIESDLEGVTNDKTEDYED